MKTEREQAEIKQQVLDYVLDFLVKSQPTRVGFEPLSAGELLPDVESLFDIDAEGLLVFFPGRTDLGEQQLLQKALAAVQSPKGPQEPGAAEVPHVQECSALASVVDNRTVVP